MDAVKNCSLEREIKMNYDQINGLNYLCNVFINEYIF